ncbi:hypothetical protein ATANTOWER_023474 [Ataeniobius toweri]|uniref:Uncharacterized protein n=1 Tax=Ataeniobius toweri TaxID=208326 RepID=A0ABU7AQT0_9TELE|nr:hypothetical protein [Ataeniobius toweri]
MERPKAGRAKQFTSHEALECITAPEEDGDSVHSSGLDSADSWDETNFIDEIDPSHDIVDDEEVEGESFCSPETTSAL